MRRPLVLVTGLLLTLPVQAADLAGFWRVEGSLPSGEGYRGVAAISPGDALGDYRLVGNARLSSGRWIRWWADAERDGARLTVRHRGSTQGLVGALLGPNGGSPPAVVGDYAIDADDDGFGGRFGPEGQPATGQARYERRALPRVRFVPEAVSTRVGERVIVEAVVSPRSAISLLRFDGDAVARVFWHGGRRKVALEPSRPGPATVSVRLGPLGGPVVAELPVAVAGGVLDEVVADVEAAVAANEDPVVIFDLDDTLFDTRYRARTILRSYGVEHDEPRLRSLSVRHVRYAMEETLVAAGFSHQEATGPLGQEIERYWSRRFFRGSSYAYDRPIRGSQAYVARLVAAGARVVYVTGRKEYTRQACLDVLADAGFPTEALFLKPRTPAGQPKLATDAFKEQVARDEVAPLGRVVAAFDNEPKNCNAFRRALPGAHVVWVDSICAPDAPPLAEGIASVKDLR